MKRSHGPHSKHSRNLRSKGRVPITHLLRVFEPGQVIRIDVNPSELRGRPSTLRFNHKHGVVLRKQGKGYEVKINDGDKPKIVFITNAHMVKA
ncbi:50S ribosomal protein L21e [Candidatus Micrarchaeota archaeon]|nr:50S ribosomal protein L21e [Candidatus Micrarchaeota archaeon]